MKRIVLAAILVFLILSPIGCGHHDNSVQIFSFSTLSTPAFDGYISVNSAGTTTTIVQGAQSLTAGIDPTNTEFRAFLEFPLSGGVPLNATIDSASLELVLNSIAVQSGNAPIPIRIELVDIPGQFLVSDDFDITPALASMTILIPQADIGLPPISVDVTPLMTKAQLSGLPNFQVRILEDPDVISPPGFIVINDTTADVAPLLTVNYF